MNKKIEFLKNYIINNGGVTLNNNGDVAFLKNGYMVSLDHDELKTDLKHLNNKLLKKYLKLAKSYNAFVGFWLDNDILYVDLSINILNKKDALSLAKNNKQLAIYDLANQVTIYL